MSALLPQICFLRGAQYAVAVGQRLDVRVFGEDPSHTWNTGPISSLAAVGDELWCVTDTSSPRLLRWAAGETMPTTTRAAGIVIPGGVGPGRFAVSPLWQNAAGWNGTLPLMIRAGASSISGEAAERSRHVAPLKPGMWLHATGSTLRLQRGATTAWQRQFPEISDVVDMQALFDDGRSIGILARTRDDKHRALVVAARDGDPQQSFPLPRFTAACFIPALGRIALGFDDRITVLDLRFRETRAEWPTSLPVGAIAVSDDGARIVYAFADAIEELPVESCAVAPIAQPAVTTEPAPVVVPSPDETEPAPIVVPSPDETIAEFASPTTATADLAAPQEPAIELSSAPLTALRPKAAAERSSAAESALVLDHHVQFVTALVVRAIAEGWDRGRINHTGDDEHPHLTEILGLLGVDAGRAPTYLAAAERRVAAAHARLLAVVRRLETRQAPLVRLAAEFGLSPLATQILTIVAAPLLRGELARLYGLLSNDVARPLVDELLLSQILGSHASRSDIARELDRDAPLRQFELVQQHGHAPRPFCGLTPAPLVLRHLRDQPMHADMEPHMRALAPLRALEQLRVPRAALTECLSALSRPRADNDPIRIVVRGRAGSGRRSVLAALAARAGRVLATIDASQPSRDPAQRLVRLKAGLIDARLRGWIPCVLGLDDVGADDHQLRSELAILFDGHPGPLTLHLPWSAEPPLAPGYQLLDLPPLLEGERVEAWTETLARHRLATDRVPELAARYRIGPGVIERAAMNVAARRSGADVGDELDRDIRQHIAIRLGQLAQKIERLPAWSDVVLPQEVRDSLVELIARIRQRRRVFETWGFDQVMTSSRGVTALFQGGPGTGKSMVAGVIARELGLDLYRVDLSRVVSKWIGETERNLATIFDAAEEGQCVLLFDEADSLFAKRTEVRSSNDRYANLEVNFLLQRLDTFEGIAVLTTNFAGAIDRAFKRRLSLRLSFPFPDEELREQLWRAHLPAQLPRGGELDVVAIARRYAMSGGYIRNAALRAAFLAAEEGTRLTQQHLERAVRLEFREIGKLSESGVLE